MAELLREMGGVATRSALLRTSSRGEVDRALASGAVVAIARGRYALPEIDDAVRVAHRHSGVLCLASAALHHGWEVKVVPDKPHVLLPRHRRSRHARDARIHYRDLFPGESDGIATSVEVTLEQCLRTLPWDEALCVADSALRHGVPPTTLARVAAAARGPGSPQVRRVVRHADGDAANPFESTLRAISLEVAGLQLVPQVLLHTDKGWFRPDLVDRERRIVVEADSFTWHGSRSALRADARRYNALVVEGWLVLRFSWEDAMFDEAEVRAVLQAAVDVQERAQVGSRPEVHAQPRACR